MRAIRRVQARAGQQNRRFYLLSFESDKPNCPRNAVLPSGHCNVFASCGSKCRSEPESREGNCRRICSLPPVAGLLVIISLSSAVPW
jgi:hypothetical protein